MVAEGMKIEVQKKVLQNGLSMATAMEIAMASWPDLGNNETKSAAAWCAKMSEQGTFVDEAFHLLVCHTYNVGVEFFTLIDVNSTSLERYAVSQCRVALLCRHYMNVLCVAGTLFQYLGGIR